MPDEKLYCPFLIWKLSCQGSDQHKLTDSQRKSEIDYVFGKNAYKTPEAFQLLVIRHFKNHCFVIINGDTIKLINPKVILGHETTIFAELQNPPNKYNSMYVKNTLFKNMPNNICELILTIKGVYQKQFILNKRFYSGLKRKTLNFL